VREPTAERGFTLIELMVVVAIIAVLAVIVVPQFTREAHKTKGKSEVTPMFAELATKEETYKAEVGTYLAAAKCPTAPTPSGYVFVTSCKTTASAWESLRVNPPEKTMRCAYTIVVGPAATTFTPPLTFLNSQGAAAAEPTPAQSWYYITAECDENGQGGTNATYYMSSMDPTIQTLNSGS
jgi:prepilin-type N-terminal cleavage/methylation domain-containing protein